MGDIKCRYDIEGLIQEMEVSEEDIWELYKTYFWEVRDNIEDIQNQLRDNEFEKVSRILHNVRGVSINLNILDVHKEATLFNEKIKMGLEENYENCLSSLMDLINGAEKEIKNFFKEKGIALE